MDRPRSKSRTGILLAPQRDDTREVSESRSYCHELGTVSLSYFSALWPSWHSVVLDAVHGIKVRQDYHVPGERLNKVTAV